MEMAAGSSPVGRLTELKNAIKTAWLKALQGSLKIRWRPFDCGSPSIKKVPELNSCSLYPESGTLHPSLFCCRILILLLPSLRTSASYPHSTEDTKHVSGLPPQRICQPYPHVIRQANDCLPESCSRTSACDRIAPIGNTNVF